MEQEVREHQNKIAPIVTNNDKSKNSLSST